MSLTGNEWQKHPIVTGLEATHPCILGIDYLRRGYFKDPKVLVGFWHNAFETDQTAVCLAWSLGGSFCCGVAEVRRRTGADDYHSSALVSISHGDSLIPNLKLICEGWCLFCWHEEQFMSVLLGPPLASKGGLMLMPLLAHKWECLLLEVKFPPCVV